MLLLLIAFVLVVQITAPSPLVPSVGFAHDAPRDPAHALPSYSREERDAGCGSDEVIRVSGPWPVTVPPGVGLDALPDQLRVWHVAALDDEGPDRCAPAEARAVAAFVDGLAAAPGATLAAWVPPPLSHCLVPRYDEEDARDLVLLLADGRAPAYVDCGRAGRRSPVLCVLRFWTEGNLYMGFVSAVPGRGLAPLLDAAPAILNGFLADLPADAPPDLAWTPLPDAVTLSPEVEALAASLAAPAD